MAHCRVPKSTPISTTSAYSPQMNKPPPAALQGHQKGTKTAKRTPNAERYDILSPPPKRAKRASTPADDGRPWNHPLSSLAAASSSSRLPDLNSVSPRPPPRQSSSSQLSSSSSSATPSAAPSAAPSVRNLDNAIPAPPNPGIFFVAAKDGDINAIDDFLKNAEISPQDIRNLVNTPHPVTTKNGAAGKLTPLGRAIIHGHLTFVKRLLELGANTGPLQMASRMTLSAPELAVLYHKGDVLAYLLDNQPDIQQDELENLICYAVWYRSNTLEGLLAYIKTSCVNGSQLIHDMLNKKPKNSSVSLLRFAVETFDNRAIQILLHYGAFPYDKSSNDGCSPAQAASDIFAQKATRLTQAQRVRIMMDADPHREQDSNGTHSLSQKTYNIMTSTDTSFQDRCDAVLAYATHKNLVNVKHQQDFNLLLQALFENKVAELVSYVNQNNFGYQEIYKMWGGAYLQPASLAARQNNPSLAAFFVKVQLQAPIPEQRDNPFRALAASYYILGNKVTELSGELKKLGVEPKVIERYLNDNAGGIYTPLEIAVGKNDFESLVHLVHNGAQVTAMTFVRAAASGSPVAIQTLARIAKKDPESLKKDLNKLCWVGKGRDRVPLTPLMEAAKAGHLKNTQKLIALGASPNITTTICKETLSALDFAVDNDHEQIVSCLLNQLEARKKEQKAQESLVRATKKNSGNVVQKLLNSRPLKTQVATLVRDVGLDPNAPDDSLLMIAVKYGAESVIPILENLGADRHQRHARGISPAECAGAALQLAEIDLRRTIACAQMASSAGSYRTLPLPPEQRR